ncbi:MAG: hypothetical protein H7641_02925 [Candidatus Heimdallarchaeota archaeon]|nr:hypothetical protein [Candidatus Heimdallarchaeota archaeon]MCK4876517.1 hypothetical protein [Candidatus Heimdallarchaeota archaeon]
MVFRIFSVQKDGSYHEVPPVKESLVYEGDAFLIIDRRGKKIYIYRKTGISSALSYSAGRAATNLKTIRGSKYRVINIEQEDKDRILTYILDKMESHPTSEIRAEPFSEKQPTSFVYGEKTRPIIQEDLGSSEPLTISFEESEAVIRDVVKDRTQIGELKNYDVEEIVKTLASKILFDTNIETAKSMEKPPRHHLRSELIKKIDVLLDSIY